MIKCNESHFPPFVLTYNLSARRNFIGKVTSYDSNLLLSIVASGYYV